MAFIGQFTRTAAGFAGRIHALGIEAGIILVPADNFDTENAPDYRAHLGSDETGPEVGAGWKRTGERAGDFVSVQLDGPTLMQPIRANLFQSPDNSASWGLHWNRTPKRTERD